MRDFERRFNKIERTVPTDNHIYFSDTEIVAKLQYLLALVSKGAQRDMTLEEKIKLIGTNGGLDTASSAKLKHLLMLAMERKAQEKKVR